MKKYFDFQGFGTSEQDIFGLQVSMDHRLVVTIAYGLVELSEDDPSIVFGQSSVRVDVMAEVASRYVLHDEYHELSPQEGVDELHNVIMSQPFERLRLLVYALQLAGVVH